jgi:hypothetical protein
LILLLLAVPVTLMAAPVTVPNSFTANTPAKAADVNANFKSLEVAVNEKDTRLNTIEAKKPAPTANGILGYATTKDGISTIASTFSSTGGAVAVSGTTGDYKVTFNNLTCVVGGLPKGSATVVPKYVSLALPGCASG